MTGQHHPDVFADNTFWEHKAEGARQNGLGGDAIPMDRLQEFLAKARGKVGELTVPAHLYLQLLASVAERRLVDMRDFCVPLSAEHIEAIATLDRQTSAPDNVIALPLPGIDEALSDTA